MTATALLITSAGCVTSSGLAPVGKLSDPSQLQASQSLAGIDANRAWPATDWWVALGNPQLTALIERALAGNPDLAIADARARDAQSQVSEAYAARFPNLTANGNFTAQRQSGTVYSEQEGGGFFYHTRGLNLGFNWDLDLWGGKRAAWEAALGEARATEIDAQAARIQLSVNVARAYTNLNYAYAQQEVAQAEAGRANEARDLTLQRVHKGIDNQAQLKQSDSEVATAVQQQAMAAQEIASARIALAILLGQGPDVGLSIQQPAALPVPALAVPGDLPANLLGRRADLVAARWRVEAASRNIASAKTEFLPNISLSAMAGLATRGGASLFQAASRTYSVTPAISLPIFDGGALRGNLQHRDAQYDVAVAQYNKTLIGALNQVADNLHSLQSMQLQIDAQQHAFDAAHDAWALADQRYRAGVGSYLEALVVRQQLLVASKRMAQLRAQHVDLSLQLVEALGGGFMPQRPDAAFAAVSPSLDIQATP
ncbi:efflux transporter outer membrane subunit [Paraburkholderia bryophila]|uniref:NodT family efflux transporter outer membrane factor (OMF) lipoprotein n=1 Tax=Paraburkholderia bryophila TaxID=420952 RepID=A0A7Y9WG05_9BURK|nr:efflux transporter outer membrane subunit [Paraburkholderia bryophila]NYH20172.1 NodT family efflux transporter outer membrane factor (OMF) lipoprotein [Paraburkholderia bryophila]